VLINPALNAVRANAVLMNAAPLYASPSPMATLEVP
jgi:hypothetical protein